MNKQLIFGFLFFIWINCWAQNQHYEELEKFFDVLEENNQFMGSVQLIKNDSLVYERNIGYSDIKNGETNNSHTHYAIGSITKTYTATLILMAFEEGKIELETSLDHFFPQVDNAQNITIQHLLQHRSGIPNITSEPDYMEWNTKPQSRKEIMEKINEYNSEFIPGTYFSYSNTNYILLTYLLEDLYQKDFASLLKEKITSKIGLSNTYYGELPSSNLALSYLYQDGWIQQPTTHFSVPLGAGAIFSTIGDMNTFASALFSGKLLSVASMELMLDTKNNFGMGIITFPYYNIIGYGHSGGIDGFQSFFGYLPYEKIGYTILSNGVRFPINDIGISLLNAVTDRPIEIPNFDNCQLDPEIQEQYIGEYSSEALPLKISVRKSDKSLSIQATGQPSIELNCEEEAHTFSYRMVGLKIIFKPEENSFRLLQSGGDFLFTKE